MLCVLTAEQLHAFEVVCAQMLEDVQERLVYRTHIYIRQEILNYNPADGDLAYPDKLQMMEVGWHEGSLSSHAIVNMEDSCNTDALHLEASVLPTWQKMKSKQ